MKDLRTYRTALELSQSKLARLSGVSRYKVCTYELGDGFLTPEEQARIREALQAECERLRKISAQFEFDQTTAKETPVESG